MKKILDAKIVFNISLHLMAILLAGVIFCVRLEMTGLKIVSIFLFPVAFSIFTAIRGMALNMKFKDFDWESEVVVIKQSVAVMLNGILGMTALSILAFVLVFFKIESDIVICAYSAIVLLLSFMIYLKAIHKEKL